MYWRDLEKEKPTKCCLCLCKNNMGEFDLLEYQMKSKYAFSKSCCWEGSERDYDYRSGDEWRYWIPLEEIDQEAMK